ncbi:glycosyl hydrolase family 28-related protein [Paraburkholderia fynbosensis]|uniref:Rhamnogalacturonase A/B/Epimerase-like pectate lyase domain-containing protein n=1 Tax=Paraburkholderia fynbosensis TaxID=1200993 RepID=A0A6J5FK70_9BURK|nr:glycosyl hydrolase family 28-related protein [Paraburkholderia fynbosensis]CAB3782032.1 hypothetical protein LMG27177_01149 [Paraburkholderia fynbosensis]
MPFNGSGSFSPKYNWQNDAALGLNISSSRMQGQDDDMAAGLSLCLTKDGQQTPIANLTMGGWRLTNLGTPVGTSDAVTKNYVDTFLASATGSSLIGFLQAGAGAVLRTVQDRLRDTVSVKDYGAAGDGTTDDSSAIQAAVTDNPGKKILFPYTGNPYLLNSNITQASPPASFIVDGGVTFSGAGKLPPASTNSFQLNVGDYLTRVPVGGTVKYGSTTLQVESLPDATFVGNAVPIYGGSVSPLGNPNFTGFLWGANFLAKMWPSTGVYNALGVEIDLDNHYQAGVGDGLRVTGVGEFSPNNGISVRRANTGSDWTTGALIQNFVTGLLIDASTSAAPQYGARIEGMSSNLLRMKPSDDLNPLSAAAFLTDSTGATVNFSISKRGGIKIGPGGTEVSKWVAGSFAISPGSIPANSTADVLVTVTGAVNGQPANAYPPSSAVPPTGITWQAWASATNTVRIRFANLTNSAVTVPDGSWRVETITH